MNPRHTDYASGLRSRNDVSRHSVARRTQCRHPRSSRRRTGAPRADGSELPGRPHAPLGRLDIQPDVEFRVDPAGSRLPAGKRRGDRTAIAGHVKLDIAIEWRRGSRAPAHGAAKPLQDAPEDALCCSCNLGSGRRFREKCHRKFPWSSKTPFGYVTQRPA